MAKKSEFQTTPFTIAHYILLFMVAVTCVSIVVWLIIARHNAAIQDGLNITKIMNNDPCVHQTRDAVTRMWAYNQELIPPKYIQMAKEYADETITNRTTGYCNDASFTCRPGQRRSVCDPCARGTGRQMALNAHIADTIKTTCDTSK